MPLAGWSVSVQVSGGTAITAAATSQTVEALDTIEVTIAPRDNDKVLTIQPGAANAIQFVLIKSSWYGTELTYKASDGTSDSPAVTLDAPQVFSGGNVVLFGLDPTQLKFSNSSPDKSATVMILVARDATP